MQGMPADTLPMSRRGRRRRSTLAAQAWLSVVTLASAGVCWAGRGWWPLPPGRGGASAPRIVRRSAAGASARAGATACYAKAKARAAEDVPAGPAVDTVAPMETRELKIPLWGEVEFFDERTARRAVEELDGMLLDDRPLCLTLDPERRPLRFVNVQGLSHDLHAPEIREFFEQVGEVKWITTGADRRYGEVRFKSPDGAWAAKTTLDGTVLLGKKIRVELDCTSDYANKVLVHGLSPSVMWQELKDHFKKAGEITFAVTHGGFTAKILFETRDGAVRAMKRLNNSKLRYQKGRLHVALPWDGTEDSAEIRVQGIPTDATVEELESHFKPAGKIMDVRIEADRLPPEFCE